MILIRDHQMEIFEKHYRLVIKQKVLRDIRANRPDECEQIGAKELRRLVDICENQIDSYDGYLEPDLYRYLLLLLDFGEDFHRVEPWAAEVFTDPDITPQSKIDVLLIYANVHRKSLTEESAEIPAPE